MKLQVLCICSNSGSSIYNTLMSWASVADRFCILINGTIDNTEAEIRRTGLTAKIWHRPFSGFASTRNKLIKLSRHQDYEYCIMIDDSFELRRTFDKEALVGDLLSIRIRNKNQQYLSARVFKLKPSIYYTGNIHETINDKVPRTGTIKGCHIQDIDYLDHVARRLNRPIIGGTDPRSTYYKACSYLDTDKAKTIQILSQNVNTTDREYNWLSLMTLARLDQINTCTWLVKASVMVPETRPECFFRCFLITGRPKFLFEAYKDCLKVPILNIPIDLSIYGRSGRVFVAYNRARLIHQLRQTKRL